MNKANNVNTVFNGSGAEKTPVQAAQERLVAAIGAQGMDIPSAAFSGYANAVVCSARLNALLETLITGGFISREMIDQATELSLAGAAQAMEERARQPKLVMPGR